ncbi:MAG: hypothetical protein KF718_22340 [Polyangiaceae bacterium]|nr:hypothetical protein [Polyangiaceae bacterium]
MTRTWLAFACCWLALLLTACGGPPAKSANPTRRLDERRAVEIIAKAFRAERDQPVPGEPIQLADGKALEVDIVASGRKYGVAYLTENERRNLGAALPPRDRTQGDALQLVRGVGDDEDATVLVLHDVDYVHDDHVGSGRSASTITAERKLERDVRDFVVRAHAERWR